MEITIEKIEKIDSKDFCSAYTVHVEDQRILTITTHINTTASKWVKDVMKSQRYKNGTLIVGLCVDNRYLNNRRDRYDLIQLCVGSHCLLYHLPDPGCVNEVPKSLVDFFNDPRVVYVGIDMVTVAKNLKKNHRISVKKPVDLRSLAFKALQRHDLDFHRYDLDRLAKVVLGKHVDVVRPEKPVEWFEKVGSCYIWWSRMLLEEKVKFATVDAYLCVAIGSELYDVIYGLSSCDSSSAKKKNKNKRF